MGGTGFIGRHLSEELSARNIAATTSSYSQRNTFLRERAKSLQFVEANSLEMKETLANAHVVVYLAHRARPASHLNKPYVEIESGLAEFARFMTELADLNPHCHVIYPSSGGQIYGSGLHAPSTENQECCPITPYGLGKLFAEQYLEFLYRTTGLRSTVLRLANPVGKWQLRGAHGFVSAAVRAAVQNDPLLLFGKGENWRDYFDADELARFIADLCEREILPTGTFNIGSGQGQTENQVIELIEQVLNRTLKVERHEARPFDMPYAVLNTDKAQEHLNWKSLTPLSASIKSIQQGMSDPLIND